MIHPSYNELIEAINENNEENDNAMLINSRYSLVLATSKRARQLIGGKEPLVDNSNNNKKPLSIAIEELYEGKVQILEDNGEEEDDNVFVHEALPADMFYEDSEDSSEEDDESEEAEYADEDEDDEYNEYDDERSGEEEED